MNYRPALSVLLAGGVVFGAPMSASAAEGDLSLSVNDAPATVFLQNGTANMVPGDREGTTITSTNDGPSDGLLSLSIINVNKVNAPSPFFDDLIVEWEVNGNLMTKRFNEVADPETLLVDIPLAQGASEDVYVGVYYDIESTQVPSRVNRPSAEFDVQFTLRGETPTTPPTTPSNTTSGTTDPTTEDDNPTVIDDDTDTSTPSDGDTVTLTPVPHPTATGDNDNGDAVYGSDNDGNGGNGNSGDGFSVAGNDGSESGRIDSGELIRQNPVAALAAGALVLAAGGGLLALVLRRRRTPAGKYA